MKYKTKYLELKELIGGMPELSSEEKRNIALGLVAREGFLTKKNQPRQVVREGRLVRDVETSEVNKLGTTSREMYNRTDLNRINNRNQKGQTQLMLSSAEGNLVAVQNLLANGADAGVKDNTGKNAFMYAVENGHLEVARTLAYEKAKDVIKAINDEVGYERITPLIVAVKSGNVPMVELILELGAKSWQGSPIVHAIRANNIPIVELLLRNEPDFHYGLSTAIQLNNIPILELLLARGADVQLGLQYAIEELNAEAVRLLVARGGNLHGQFNYFPLPIIIEVIIREMQKARSMNQSPNSHLLKILLDAGLNVNTLANLDFLRFTSQPLMVTPLIWSAHIDNIDAFKMLLARGADTNITDSNGGTVDSYVQGKPEFVRLLEEHRKGK